MLVMICTPLTAGYDVSRDGWLCTAPWPQALPTLLHVCSALPEPTVPRQVRAVACRTAIVRAVACVCIRIHSVEPNRAGGDYYLKRFHAALQHQTLAHCTFSRAVSHRSYHIALFFLAPYPISFCYEVSYDNFRLECGAVQGEKQKSMPVMLQDQCQSEA